MPQSLLFNMSFPLEIIDYILGFLQSDTTTLKACSKGHPTLAQLVERHLYTNVKVQDGIVPDDDDFCNILRDRPYVANYVHALEIQFGQSKNPKAFLKDISPILPALSMLRSIALSYNGSKILHSAWRIPDQFRLAFIECLHLPSLVDISIEGLPFSLSILSHCKHIKNLSLRFWTDAWDNETRLPTRIDSLAFHGCRPETLFSVTSWIHSCDVVSLSFSRHHFQNVAHILLSCSHSLTKLDVDIRERFSSYYSFMNLAPTPANNSIPITLSVLPNLRQLIIRAQLNFISTRMGFSCGCFSPIPALANLVKSASSIKRLTLDFHFFIKMNQNDEHHITAVFCIPFHSLIQSAPAIDSIKLHVNSNLVPNRSTLSPDAIISSLTRHSGLMELVENGKLVIDS